jgi:TIR domain
MSDAFLSYASEDTKVAQRLFAELSARGFDIWYAPMDLKVGQKLLDSIEEGMAQSRAGILLISPSYLAKGWPNYEMDTLMRYHIETKKLLYPVWLNVTKEQVAARHSGLAGIVAVRINEGFDRALTALVSRLAGGAPTIAVIPIYESPKFRFLQGRGEVNIGTADGPATSLWELLIHLPESGYPVFLGGESYEKENLLIRAAQILPHIPDVVKRYVGDSGYNEIWEMCKAAGIDPKDFE